MNSLSAKEKGVVTIAPASFRGQSVAEVLIARPPGPFYKDAGALKLYSVLIPGVLLVSSTSGYEGSMMNGIQGLNTWNEYFHPSTAITGLINSSFWMGAILAYPFAQIIGDRWGRKNVIYSGAIISIIGTVLQTAANSTAMFVVGRIFFGFCSTLSGNAASVLVAESAHPRDRKVLSSLYNSSYYIGAILAAWSTYGTGKHLSSSWTWRIPSLLQGVLAVFNCTFLPFVPESPRWLIAQGKRDAALHNLARGHGNGDINDLLIHAEVREIEHGLDILNRTNAWNDLFRRRVNRKRLFLLVFIGVCLNWSGNGLVSYYLSKVLNAVGVTSEDKQTLINGILSIVSWVTSIAAAWVSGWQRRRTQFLTSSIVMLGSFIAVMVADSIVIDHPGNKGASYSVIFFIFLFMCGYNWAFNPLAYAYPVEILPYNLRVVGTSTVLFWCTLAGFFNQWVNPVGLEAITWRYYIVYVAWLAVEVVVIYFTFPETLGYSLEEVSPLLDTDKFITLLKERHTVKHATSQLESELST